MPVGIQLVGKPGGEYELFQHARAIEQITGWSWAPIDPINPVGSVKIDRR